jgi:hypothetical protein
MTTPGLQWASSKTAGRISEIAVLSPVRTGRVPGERRTYEERAAAVIDRLEARVQQGLPNLLNKVSSIHFGRIMLIRPEQYMLYSQGSGLSMDEKSCAPTPIDDYESEPDAPTDKAAQRRRRRPHVRSFLLTTVEFDGDLRVYFRDIAVFLNDGFDQLFENCEDFPGTENFEAFWQWIRRYQINTALFYSAYPQLSVTRIKQLELFKRRFDDFVAKVRSPTGPRVASMDALFDEFLRENQQIAYGFPAPGGTYQPNGQDERGL